MTAHELRTFDPATLETQQIYKLMTGLIVPRPVALVSTVDKDGVRNVAPFSFFCGVGSNPPTVLFCPSLMHPPGGATDPQSETRPADRPDDRKDTLRNVEQTGEFVINIVSEAIAEATNVTAANVAPDVDEFALAGLTPIASELVRPPRVAESPAQMECRLMQIIFTGKGLAAGVIVLGEVVRFHVAAALEQNFRIDPAALAAVGRMAGNTWVRTQERFELIRPK